MPTGATPNHNAAAAGSSLARFIQCRSPAVLYEWMRRHSLQTRRSMNSIVLEAVAASRADLDAGQGAPGQPPRDGGRQVAYNVRLDTDTYNWLRTTAFYARTSINALIVAALARAQADHAEGTAAPDAG